MLQQWAAASTNPGSLGTWCNNVPGKVRLTQGAENRGIGGEYITEQLETPGALPNPAKVNNVSYSPIINLLSGETEI